MMFTGKDLKKAAQRAKAQRRAALVLDGATLQLYDGSPFQFNATVEGNRFPTIKFEERTAGKFTVAVAPDDGASIDYTQAKVFAVDEPLEHIAANFPQSSDMRQFINCLVSSN